MKAPKGQKVAAPAPLVVQARLGATVKAHRQRLGVTQEELAWRADMHRTYIADIERGARNITLRSLINLAAALQISVSQLLAEPGESVPAPGEVGRPGEILVIQAGAQDAAATTRALAAAHIANPVTVVGDGEEALEFLFARGRFGRRSPADQPALVLLDPDLPGLSGGEIIRRLRESEATREVPVVLLTATPEKAAVEYSELGVEQQLVKPLSAGQLQEIAPGKLQRLLVRRRRDGG